MVVFCVKTEKQEVVKRFVANTNRRISNGNIKNFFIKNNNSFSYVIKDKNNYIIIVNIEGIIFSLPKTICYLIMKRGLRKGGYKGSIELVKTHNALYILAKVFKNLPRRNIKVSE